MNMATKVILSLHSDISSEHRTGFRMDIRVYELGVGRRGVLQRRGPGAETRRGNLAFLSAGRVSLWNQC
jgi:hypothetical protein